MKIITACRGTPITSLDSELLATMNSRKGSYYLDSNNCFKEDTDIVFIKKRNCVKT